ncbi:hypothetical protein LI177_05850 [bacterium 210820-DFI.6.37]|nr:hypothetical protein [bacterium 210820-DFI.6.37]
MKKNIHKEELIDVERFVENELKKELEIFDRHIARYQKMSLTERKKQAKESLINSGVLNKDGTEKSAIIVR